VTTAKDVPSALMRQTLLDRELVKPVERPVIRVLPWLTVVSIGGRAIIDRGRDVLLPVVDELRELLPEHRMLILTGAGIRARHVLGVGLDLGLPTGVLASLAGVESEQNGHLVAALLAGEGVSYLPQGGAAHQLAVHLAASRAVVSNAFPPYGLHEFPPAVGKIPVHRSDAGAFLLADAYGAQRLVYVKDRDLGTTTIGAAELRDRGDSPVEALVLDLMANAKHMREIHVVNGRDRGALSDAVNGKPAGTVIAA
jgi:molybdenum storage protein